MAKSKWHENDDALINALVRKARGARSFLIEVVNGPTSGASYTTKREVRIIGRDEKGLFTTVPFGEVEERETVFRGRTGRDNAKIRWIQQRKFNRNPWFLYARETNPIKQELNKWGPLTSGVELSAVADKIGRTLELTFKRHIREKKTKGGKDMPPNTQRWMRRKFEATGKRLPPLIYSGQLLKSVVNRVKEV